MTARSVPLAVLLLALPGAAAARAVSMEDRVVAAIGDKAYMWVTLAGTLATLLWFMGQLRDRMARQRRSWRERGDAMGEPFESRLATRLRELDDRAN